MNSMLAVGKIPGILMCRIQRRRLAPSISAASYSSTSILDNVARYIIEFHPADCHIPEMIYKGLNHWGLPMKFTAFPPNAMISLLIMPIEGEVKLFIIPTRTTMDMK